jgi:hypothetical protein
MRVFLFPFLFLKTKNRYYKKSGFQMVEIIDGKQSHSNTVIKKQDLKLNGRQFNYSNKLLPVIKSFPVFRSQYLDVHCNKYLLLKIFERVRYWGCVITGMESRQIFTRYRGLSSGKLSVETCTIFQNESLASPPLKPPTANPGTTRDVSSKAHWRRIDSSRPPCTMGNKFWRSGLKQWRRPVWQN